MKTERAQAKDRHLCRRSSHLAELRLLVSRAEKSHALLSRLLVLKVELKELETQGKINKRA